MSYLGSLNPYMSTSNYAEELRRRQEMLTGPEPAPQMSMNQPQAQMSPNREPTREERISAMLRGSMRDMTAEERGLKQQQGYAQSLLNTPSAGLRRAGNVVVNNPWEGLAVGIQRGLGGYMMGKAAERDKELQAKRDAIAEQSAELQAFKLGTALDQQDLANRLSAAGVQADLAAAGLGADKDLTQWEQNARRDFTKDTKQFRLVDDSFGKILSASEPDNQTAQTQMSLIFSYMKMLDPGSTVREGEFATAEETTGIPGQVVNAYNRALSGEFLEPVQVAGFRESAGDIYKNALSAFDNDVAYYTRLAEDRGANVENVIRKDLSRFRGYGKPETSTTDKGDPESQLIKPPTTSQAIWDNADDDQKRMMMQAAGMLP